MKARVNSPMSKVAAGVNVSEEKATIISEVMAGIGGEYKNAGQDCGADLIGYICCHKGYARSEERVNVEEELLIFSGLDSKDLNVVIAGLRDRGCSIPLKAMVTPHNKDWTVAALSSELAKEHELMQNRGRRDENG